MGRWDRRAAALWHEQYGPLAGWLAAIAGDEGAARAVADEAFVATFGRMWPLRSPRIVLYSTALRLVDQRIAGWIACDEEPASAAGWLGPLAEAPQCFARRCLLLHHGGLDPAEIAGVLHVRQSSVLAELRRAIPDGSVSGELGHQLGDGELRREPGGVRADVVRTP